MRAKINPENIISYILGNLRYKIYYSVFFKWMMRKHIREQIDFRVSVMDKGCYMSGSCKICGCKTVALQMADKPCDKPCYPEMMDKMFWNLFKNWKLQYPDKNGRWFLDENKDLYLNGNKI